MMLDLSTTAHEKAQILHQLRSIGARRVLEIGAFEGHTTRVLCDAVAERDGTVVVIDPMRWSSEIVRNGLARHLASSFPGVVAMLERALGNRGYEDAFWKNVGHHAGRVVLHRELSNDPALLEANFPELQEFDAVFVDGDHSYEGASHDIERWGRRVRAGGLILVHDATPRFPGVVRALQDLRRDQRVQLEWPTQDSLCVVRVNGELRWKVGRDYVAPEMGDTGTFAAR